MYEFIREDIVKKPETGVNGEEVGRDAAGYSGNDSDDGGGDGGERVGVRERERENRLTAERKDLGYLRKRPFSSLP
jgi:hypothetical protein